MSWPGLARLPALYLASRSPQRGALLAQWGVAFRLVEPGAEPPAGEGPPEEIALALARAKALGARLAGLPPGLVLGADTLVVHPEGRILGKPRDREQAGEFLKALSGHRHRVVSALWLDGHPDPGPARGGVDTSLVSFRTIAADEIEEYLDGGEWKGKAGAYALQGLARAFVRELVGEEETVIGLPRSLTRWALETWAAR